MNYLLSIIALFTIGLVTPTSTNAPMSAKDIMAKNKELSESGDQEVAFTLDLINKKGKKRRQESIWTYLTDDSDVRYSLFRFHAPSDVKGTGFLSIEYPAKTDDRWLFLPALGRSRRISANEKTDRFMGSDFTYEDLERVNLVDFDYALLGETTIDGQVCHKIEGIPNNANTKKVSGYSKRVFYVLKDRYQTIKIEYFNKKGELSKIFLGKDIKKVAGSTDPKVHYMEMQNLETNHTSIINFSNFKIDSGIETDQFSVRALEKI